MDYNEWAVKFKVQTDVIKKFNLFIEQFCADDYSHLIDSDDNPGEEMREAIRGAILSSYDTGADAVKDYYRQKLSESLS